MISSDNVPLNDQACDSDFTVDSYRELLAIAKQRFEFANYDAIPWGQRFVLLRHDCDFSLNRAHALAVIEASEGVRSTFFLNPHCEFYNIFEQAQYRLVREILDMGHQIGLHFDGAFYEISDEKDLARHICSEAELLGGLYGVKPKVFSFHNPVASHMSCEADTYGGLINCYSRRFKLEVPYCSDSNGYWRFRRLREVLIQGDDSCLQVLTHAGWWQEKPMPPRQRIFRSVYGRAFALMQKNDSILAAQQRVNLAGAAQALHFLQPLNEKLYYLYDFLWMSREIQALFLELWRLHERQINKLCKSMMRKHWQVSANQVNLFFEDPRLAIDGWKLFTAVFDQSWQEVTGTEPAAHQEWLAVRNQLVHGRASLEPDRLENGCVYLCKLIESLAAWGKASQLAYDGVAHLGSIGLPTCKTADGDLTDRLEEIASDIPDFPTKRWMQFKRTLETTSPLETKA